MSCVKDLRYWIAPVCKFFLPAILNSFLLIRAVGE